MSIFDEKNLTKWVVIIPVISVILTAVVFVITGIKNRSDILKNESYQKQIKLLKEHKLEAMQKVNNMVSFLKNSEELQKEQSEQNVKQMVELALTIINDIYKNNQKLTNKEIFKKINSSLREIRFWNGTGYFFIDKLDGMCILMPPMPSMENTNLLSLQDAKGKYTIRDAIAIVKEKDEGFSEWYWYKPNEKKMKKKIGFVKIFKPLDIYIGTARYEEDIINSIKSKMIPLLKNSGDDDFFIYNEFGKSILNNEKSIGTDKLSMIIKGAKVIPEGFFINHTSSAYYDISKELKAGTFFVRYLPEFNWVVGFDTYTEKVIKSLKKEEERQKANNVALIKNRLFFASIILLIVLLVTTFFSSKLKKVIKRYQANLIKQHKVTLQQQEKLTHNLKHDYLTSLPNRLLLTDRLEQEIKHFKRTNKQVAVIFIDVDKFKRINDSLGHNIGDMILKKIAKRLKNSIRNSDTVSRFGGDEYVVLIDDFKNIYDIIKIIMKIQNSFKKEIKIEDSIHNITLSMGISVFPNDGNNVETLLKNADIAMYKAKDEGGNRYRFFTQKMNEETQKQIKLEKELKVAVKRNEFVLHYQPLVELKSGNIVGVEALIRWNHPTKGLIFPDQFIDIAEQNSVIIDMGQWILHESMSQMSEWKAKGYKLEKMSINIAIMQLENSDFIQSIKDMLYKTSCHAKWIEIEIIERFAMKNIAKSIEILNEIRKMNIDIAIDDFGTGHSSLAYLKQLPITKLKIDRVFVSNVLKSNKDKAIAESIMALGSGLNITVLAEGIETENEKEFFAYHNCQQMQGYLFSKPLPALEVEKLLKKGSCG